MDGTVVNTLDDIAYNINLMLSYYSFKTHTVEEIKGMIGNGAKKLVERALPKEKVNENFLDEALKTYQNFYDKNIVKDTFVYEGLENVLVSLKNSGVKLAVISNKDERHVTEVIDVLLPGIFDIVWGYNGRFPHKPDPSSVIAIIDIFGLTKEEVAFVGDSKVDILTAKNTGIKSVGVSWGFGGVHSFDECTPDIIIDLPQELLKI